MKKLFVLCIAMMLAVLPVGMAMAETIMIYGSVVCMQPQSVVCAAEGAIEQVNYSVGDRVSTGDVIATIATQKVYASTDGTVYLFGEEGEQIADITAKYGAVAYIAPSAPYTITATATDRNGLAVSVIPGETVYLRCYKDGKHTGKGILAKVGNGKYTVVVTEGEFANNETVSIYRDEAYSDPSRIGRAKVATADMVASNGDGYLVKFHVANGTEVEKGTLLYETICGDFVPGAVQLSNVVSPVDGIISDIYEDAGVDLAGVISEDEESTTPTAAHVIATIYPDSCLRVVAYAPESVLNDIHVNDTVYVTCQYIENMAEPVVGTVEKISRIPSPEDSGVEAQYAVYVTVEDASCFYYGMNVTVTAGNNN